MVLRIIGVLIVTIGCGVGGFLLAAAYRKEIRSLASFIDLLNYFECELQYRRPPLSDIFSSFSVTRKDSISKFANQLSSELDAQICPNVQACVMTTLKNNTDITPETSKFLEKLGVTLGKFDIEGQILEIKSLRMDAKNKLDYLLNNQDRKISNYKTLGLCAGAAIAILLI